MVIRTRKRRQFFALFLSAAIIGRHEVSGGMMDVHLTLLAEHNSIDLLKSDSASSDTSVTGEPTIQVDDINELETILLSSPEFLSVHRNNGKKRKKSRNLRNGIERDLNNSHGDGIPMVSTILELTNPEEALKELRDSGVVIRAIFPNNMVTADVPVLNVKSLGSSSNVKRMEAAHTKHLLNDISNSFQTITLDNEDNPSSSSGEPPVAYVGMNNTRTSTGKGVVVGILDTGVDWTHEDFINEDGTSRILYYWDQSDFDDDAPPNDIKGLENSFGHEYTQEDFNTALLEFDNTWDQRTNSFDPTSNRSYPIKSSARDMSGHGTHVAGTAAGNGRGSNQMGVAPEASLIVVKFGFSVPPEEEDDEDDENEEAGEREGRANSASYVEGVYYIMKRAHALGMPVVVNLSLGSDYGPHDGSTLEERVLDDIIGPGRIVVAASGNSGTLNWNESLSRGFALHGSGNFKRGESITVRMPDIKPGYFCDDVARDEIFISGWYSGLDEMRIQITTPGGVVLPPRGYEHYWSTKGPSGAVKTREGMVLVGNGGDLLGWNDTNIDHEMYISIQNTDYPIPPAEGEWKIEFLSVKSKRIGSDDGAAMLSNFITEDLTLGEEEDEMPDFSKDPSKGGGNGDFHVWYGASNSVKYAWFQEPHPREPTPQINGRDPDNRYTTNIPATANKVIAVGAYISRTEWTYYDPTRNRESRDTQTFGKPFTVDRLGELAYFSSRGPRRDNVTKPEITAPGVGVASSYSHFVRQAEWDIVEQLKEGKRRQSCARPTFLESGYVLPNLEAVVLKGTSMATPNVAGAVALLLGENPSLDYGAVRKILAETSLKDFYTETYEHYEKTGDMGEADSDTDVGPSNEDWGLGKINIYAALNEVKQEIR